MQRKSTADSSNPRSLSQLDTIVMEGLRQNLKRKPLQPFSSRPCCPQKGALHSTSAFVAQCVDNREIWPRYVSVLRMMTLKDMVKPGHL